MFSKVTSPVALIRARQGQGMVHSYTEVFAATHPVLIPGQPLAADYKGLGLLHVEGQGRGSRATQGMTYLSKPDMAPVAMDTRKRTNPGTAHPSLLHTASP